MNTTSNNNPSNAYPIKIKVMDLGMGEYDINDVMFNIPSLQEMGRLSESPSVIGQIVPLGEVPN